MSNKCKLVDHIHYMHKDCKYELDFNLILSFMVILIFGLRIESMLSEHYLLHIFCLCGALGFASLCLVC